MKSPPLEFRNGVYPDRSFGRTRQRSRSLLRRRLESWLADAIVISGTLFAILGVVTLLVLVIVGPIWLLLAIGRAIGAV